MMTPGAGISLEVSKSELCQMQVFYHLYIKEAHGFGSLIDQSIIDWYFSFSGIFFMRLNCHSLNTRYDQNATDLIGLSYEIQGTGNH